MVNIGNKEIKMAEQLLDEKRIKELLKEAVIDALSERRDLFYDVVAEVMEDFAMARAIEDGKATDSVSKEEVLKAL
jgi:hypothetical protein